MFAMLMDYIVIMSCEGITDLKTAIIQFSVLLIKTFLMKAVIISTDMYAQMAKSHLRTVSIDILLTSTFFQSLFNLIVGEIICMNNVII